MNLKFLLLCTLTYFAVTKAPNNIDHFIIQATMPEGCGHSYISKKIIFDSVKDALMATIQCNCFKDKVDFYFGELKKEIKIIDNNAETGWNDEFNFFLYIKERNADSYTCKLIATSFREDTNHFYHHLHDKTNKDELLNGIIDQVCSYCDPLK